MPLDPSTSFANRDVARYMYNLFWARHDVFARKFIYQSGPLRGKKGYAPRCLNAWKVGICKKHGAKESKKTTAKSCNDCEHKKYASLTETAFLRHLRGQISIGVYPLLDGGICWFCAADFDDHAAKEPEDSCLMTGARVVQAGEEYGINVFLERSGGGRGAHSWVFFRQAIPAQLARQLMFGLFVRSGLPNPGSIEIFPKQDGEVEMGNLIAVPFQGPKRVSMNFSVFVEPDTFQPITPCHMALPQMVAGRHSLAEVNGVVGRMKKDGVLKSWSGSTRRQRKTSRTRAKQGKRSTENKSLIPRFVSNPINAIYLGCAALQRIRERAEGISEPLPRAKDGLTHEERLAIASIMRELPGGRDEIHRLLRKCPDYDEVYTNNQIDSMKGAPWTCKTLRRFEICGGLCAKMKELGKRSPVAFAYQRKRPRRVQDATKPLAEHTAEEPKSSNQLDKSAVERFFEIFGQGS